MPGPATRTGGLGTSPSLLMSHWRVIRVLQRVVITRVIKCNDSSIPYLAEQYSQAKGLSSECLLRTWFLRVTLFAKPLARQISHCKCIKFLSFSSGTLTLHGYSPRFFSSSTADCRCIQCHINFRIRTLDALTISYQMCKTEGSTG